MGLKFHLEKEGATVAVGGGVEVSDTGNDTFTLIRNNNEFII